MTQAFIGTQQNTLSTKWNFLLHSKNVRQNAALLSCLEIGFQNMIFVQTLVYCNSKLNFEQG